MVFAVIVPATLVVVLELFVGRELCGVVRDVARCRAGRLRGELVSGARHERARVWTPEPAGACTLPNLSHGPRS